MKNYSIYHNEILLFPHARLANSFFTRAKGLLGCSSLKPEEALIIIPCNGVHTLAMSWAIDVIFIDQKGAVLKSVERLLPYRFARESSATSTIEVAAGMVAKYALKRGDLLSWSLTETV